MVFFPFFSLVMMIRMMMVVVMIKVFGTLAPPRQTAGDPNPHAVLSEGLGVESC